MLEDLADALFFYLAPILSLVGPLLVLLSFISPESRMGNQPSLVVIKPSSNSSTTPDGPSFFIGLLRYCSKTNNSTPIHCTGRTVEPTYDLKELPQGVPNMFDPVVGTPHFIAVSQVLLWLFFLFFAALAARAKWGDKYLDVWAVKQLDKPLVQRTCAWSGLVGLVVGVSSFGIVHIWFGKAVVDFNKSVEYNRGGQVAIADLSRGFSMGWIGYALQAVPLICALMKVHMTAQRKPRETAGIS